MLHAAFDLPQIQPLSDRPEHGRADFSSARQQSFNNADAGVVWPGSGSQPKTSVVAHFQTNPVLSDRKRAVLGLEASPIYAMVARTKVFGALQGVMISAALPVSSHAEPTTPHRAASARGRAHARPGVASPQRRFRRAYNRGRTMTRENARRGVAWPCVRFRGRTPSADRGIGRSSTLMFSGCTTVVRCPIMSYCRRCSVIQLGLQVRIEDVHEDERRRASPIIQ